jgi:hypothetical protein
MATILRLQPRAKVEDSSVFSSHSGNVYIEVLSDETKTFTVWRIYAASPTTSHFNAAPIGSELTNTANGVKYRKTAAATWATVTQA